MGTGVQMVSNWRLTLLLTALAVEFAFGLVIRLHEVGRFVDGDRDLISTAAVAGLGWLLVVGIAVALVAQHLYGLRRAVYRQSQVIAADAATSSDWVWESDTAHRLTYSSDGVTTLLGYLPEELVGVSALSLLDPSQVAQAEKLVSSALVSNSGWGQVELIWRHKDGTPVTLQGTAAPILDEKGQVVGFRGTRRRLTEAMATERALVAAKQRITDLVSDECIDVALQPIVDIVTGSLAGVEALARFRDGRGPDEWFADARATGQILDLDGLAFRAALKLLPNLPSDCYLSVNATPGLLTEGALARELCNGALPLDRLVIEITEHVKISSYPDLHASLAQLRERGVRLAIDDTGAGYASLSHVLQLRPDIIKIDRSLITNISDDPARRSLVTSLVLLALDLGASLTGEGVETPAELETLATLGVDCAQGYLLARPTTDTHKWTRWYNRNWHQPTYGRTSAAATYPDPGNRPRSTRRRTPTN